MSLSSNKQRQSTEWYFVAPDVHKIAITRLSRFVIIIGIIKED